jgi:hypothetical protein
MMNSQEVPNGANLEKLEFNRRAKASMLEYLKSRTWPEKVRSMERMNEATKIAREAMRKARAAQGESH